MSDRAEPVENIAGEGGEAMSAAELDDVETRAGAIVHTLSELYWRKRYGDRDAFACLVRTILSQNTSDVASQPAYDTLLERYDEGDLLAELADANHDLVAETIRSAGLYNQKARVLIGAATTIESTYGTQAAFDAFVTDEDPQAVREWLLTLTGVGPKTADCVLLFAGGHGGIFPVDTHVHRIARRMGIAPADGDHETVRRALEDAVPPEWCGSGHTTMIQFGREYCTATDPACLDGLAACPLADRCDRVGVSPDSGTVRDPAETIE